MKSKEILFEQILSYRNVSGIALRDMIFDTHNKLIDDDKRANDLTKEYIDSIYEKFFKE